MQEVRRKAVWRVNVNGAQRISSRGGSPSTQQSRAELTRHSLILTASTLFGANGFHSTGTPELVDAAGVTRGTLYHHFLSKEGLFEAVFIEALRELNEDARAWVGDIIGQTWSKFVGALHRYLRLLAERADLRRIILIDGPSVLGWSRWHALQAEWIQAGITETLELLNEGGMLALRDPQSTALLIQGAINEAALAIAHSDDPALAMGDLNDALAGLLNGLRVSNRGAA